MSNWLSSMLRCKITLLDSSARKNYSRTVGYFSINLSFIILKPSGHFNFSFCFSLSFFSSSLSEISFRQRQSFSIVVFSLSAFIILIVPVSDMKFSERYRVQSLILSKAMTSWKLEAPLSLILFCLRLRNLRLQGVLLANSLIIMAPEHSSEHQSNLRSVKEEVRLSENFFRSQVVSFRSRLHMLRLVKDPFL